MNTYHCDEDDAKDVYQATIISFYENIMMGRLSELKSTVKTYLFAIGKYKVLELQRKQGRFSALGIVPDVIDDENDEPVDPALVNLAVESLDRLGEPCKTLLKEFYFHRSTMAAIVAKLGYRNEDAAKSQKYKCLLRLKKIFRETYTKKQMHE
jgi:DNA-directed RNA polymerase specialized sigma24 family protein